MTVFTSLFFSWFMNVVGRRNTNAISQIMFILHYSVLVYLDYEYSTERFFWLSILTAIFGACGQGANSASTMAIIATLDEE